MAEKIHRTQGAGFDLLKLTGNPSSVAVKSSDYTILDNDGLRTIICDDTTAQRTFTLPTLADNQGRVLEFMNLSTQKGGLVIDGEGGETIADLLTIELPMKHSSMIIIAQSTGWILRLSHIQT